MHTPPKRSVLLRPVRLAALLLLLVLSGTGQAQLLGEVLTVAAISAELDPGIRFPRGTLRLVGAPPPTLLGRVRDRGGYVGWEAYTASGVAANLFPAHLRSVANGFALAGYFPVGQEEWTVGAETHTRWRFEGPDGSRTVLYAIRTGGEIVWFVGRAR